MRDRDRKAWLYRVDQELIAEFKDKLDSEILDNIDIEISFSMPLRPFEPDDKLPHYYITASYNDYGEDDDSPRITQVAFAEVVILDPMSDDEDSLFDQCDAESEDMYNVYQALFDEDENLLEPLEEHNLSPICYLAEFIIEEELEKFKSDFLDWIIEYFNVFSPILVTLPVPSQVEVRNDTCFITRDFEKEKVKKLRRFFTTHRFFPLRNTDFMYHLYENSMA